MRSDRPSPLTRRHLFAAGAALAAPTILPAGARAQAAWKPERPVTLYNPFAAGGSTDVHMRFLAEKAGKVLGQQVIVDVKPGAAGTLAAATMAPMKPDGHAIACMSINSLRYPHYQQAAWHPLRDFTYIIGVSAYTIGVVVRADSPWKTIEDLIAAGKKEPEKFNYGTSGIGGTGHLMMIEIEQSTGAKFTHIPYKGGAEWMQAMLGGHIQFIPDASQWAPFVDNGQVRILAMATEKRFPKYPDAPTLVERGINVVAHSPYGLVGPKDMPANVVQGLHDAFKAAMDDPAHQQLLDRVIQATWYKTPAEYRAFAEKYYVDVKPMLVKAGLAKG
ncbi:MAG: tripartite tricarboxylate transporter substrate binding protein [Rhodospirillales bacterium]|nr:tripartite tricarboxylate transporter substrate binding protein [Rhodospirillales bacterium]QQS14367.1 MAG: tripartite tricarboxylate transporter substrate binding protein [Rhodospirillales bacterium]